MHLRFPARLPILMAGLFAGRILSEWVTLRWPTLPASFSLRFALAVPLTFVAIGLSYWLWKRLGKPELWPLMGLSLYVLAPTQSPRWLWAAVATTLLLFLLTGRLDHWLESRWRPDRVGLIAIGTTFGLAYLTTLAPDILPADNGEFQLRAAQLGVAHPPGFPLYTLLAHLMTRLPLGPSPAWRVNLFGLLCGLATLLVVYETTYRLYQSNVAALTAASLLGVATTFWAQATTANIRSLTALFAAMMFYCVIAWDQSEPESLGGKRWAWRFTLVAVLGVGHHASLIFSGFVLFLYMVLRAPGWWRRGRNWLPLLGAVALGLLPLFYLVWRGWAGAPGAPPDLATWNGFINHVTARGFQGDLFHFLAWPDFADRLRVMVEVYRFQWSLPLSLIALLGWLILLRRRRAIALLCLVNLLIHTLITATYRAPQTVEYMLPALVPWVLAAAAGPGLLPAGRNCLPPQRQHWALLATLFFLLIGAQFSRLYPTFGQIRAENDTRRYVDGLVSAAPDSALLLADWHWATPLWYVQAFEQPEAAFEVAYVFPTAEPYGETWARRIREAGDRPVLTTHFDPTTYTELGSYTKLDHGYLFPSMIGMVGSSQVGTLDLHLGEQLIVHSVAPVSQVGRPTESLAIWVEAEALAPEALAETTLFLHLVDEAGRLVAQQDVALFGLAGRARLRFTLTPYLQALPGPHQLYVGAYNATDGTPMPEQSSGEDRSAVTVITVQAQHQQPFTQNPTYRPDILNPRILTGYDWDTTIPAEPRLYLHWRVESGYVTELASLHDGIFRAPLWSGPWGLPIRTELKPQATQYLPLGQGIVWLGPLWPTQPAPQPGELVHLAGTWGSSRPIYRDLAVAMRLVGYLEDSDLWAWSELDNRFGVPAMGAIPTLKWVGGTTVYDTHRLAVAPAAEAGQRIGVIVGLFDTMTNEPVPLLDERFAAATPWYITAVGRATAD